MHIAVGVPVRMQYKQSFFETEIYKTVVTSVELVTQTDWCRFQGSGGHAYMLGVVRDVYRHTRLRGSLVAIVL